MNTNNISMSRLSDPAELLIHYHSIISYNHINYIRDRNDCSIIAISMMFGYSYLEAYKICSRWGRKKDKGFNTVQLKHMIYAIAGMDARPEYKIRKPDGKSKYSVRTIPDILPVGKYFIFTRDHILTMIDGVVYDWTEDRRHHVISVIEIGELIDLL